MLPALVSEAQSTLLVLASGMALRGPIETILHDPDLYNQIHLSFSILGLSITTAVGHSEKLRDLCIILLEFILSRQCTHLMHHHSPPRTARRPHCFVWCWSGSTHGTSAQDHWLR